MKNYTTAAAVGLILGFAMVWWVRPDTNAGASFLVVASMLLCFVLGIALPIVGKLFRKRRVYSGRAVKHDDIT